MQQEKRRFITYEGASIRLSGDLSSETFQSGRNWHEIFIVTKSKDIQATTLPKQGYHLKIEGKIKIFPDKKKAKGVCYRQTSITEMLKGLL